MGPDEFNPILSIFIHVSAEEDRVHIGQRFEVLARQDPKLRVRLEYREEKLVLTGEDELELESVCGKILGAELVEVDDLRIEYRETIRKPAEAEGKYIRQTGGSGNYGHCWLKVEPNEPGKGYEFINGIKRGVVPKEYIKPIDQGIQGALELGILAGFPIVDVKVTLFDGSYHEVDSNEMAFKFAGSIAFKEAARKASPVLLEPVMAVEVTVPEEFMGTIIGDINSRRGRILNFDLQARSALIHAIVPLAEALQSSAHGRLRFPMHFAGYEPARWQDGFGDDEPTHVLNPKRPKSGGKGATAE